MRGDNYREGPVLWSDQDQAKKFPDLLYNIKENRTVNSQFKINISSKVSLL